MFRRIFTMHFSILPKKKEAQTDNSSKELFLLFEKETSITNFLTQNLTLILSFFIPFVTLLTFFYIYGFAPFGQQSIFTSDALSQILSNLSHMQSLMQNNGETIFSAFNYIEDSLFDFLFFFSSPSRFITLFMSFKNALVYLHLLIILEISLAGAFFTYFLLHRADDHSFKRNDFSVLLFSCAYALGSFTLTRYNDFAYVEIAMIFPLLFCSFEQLMINRKAKAFLVLLCLCFISQFYVTLIILAFLFMYLFFMPNKTQKSKPALLLFYLLHVLPCLLLCAIIIVPGLYLHVVYQTAGNSIPDFVYANDWFTFFSRFWPSGTTAFSISSISHSNAMYMGLFVLFFLVLYIFQKGKSYKDTLKSVFFIFLLLFSMNQSQMQFLLRLGSNNEFAINCYGFFVVFFLLMFCSRIYYQIQNTPVIGKILSIIVPFSLYFLTVRFGKGEIRKSSIFITLILLVIYSLYFIFHYIHSIKPTTFYGLLLVTTIVELLLNAGSILQDVRYYSSTLNESAVIAAYQPKISHTPFSVSFRDFTLPSEFCTDTYSPASLTETGSMFDSENEKASLFHPDAPLFEKANLSVECIGLDENLTFRSFQNGIFTIGRRALSQPDYIDTLLKDNTMPTTVTLSITPHETGDLYLYLEDFVHIGEVKANEAFTYSFQGRYTRNFYSNYQIQGAYCNNDVLSQITDNIANPDVVKTFETPFSAHYETEMSKDCVFVSNILFSKMIQVSVDGKKQDAFESICHTTALKLSKGTHTITYRIYFPAFYAGMILSLICLFSLLPGKITKKGTQLTPIEDKLLSFGQNVSLFGQRHRYLLLSFFIPFFILILNLIIASCRPFGHNAWFSNDGFLLTYAMLKQKQHELLQGNLLFSWTMGGGTNIFNTMPTTFLYIWLLLIPQQHLYVCLVIFAIIKIALCGSTMFLYLRRKECFSNSRHASAFALFLSCAYPLSAYILNMNSYFHWLTVFMLFPLILISLEKYIEKGKSIIPYILLLAFAIISDYNISLFICIFLIFWFFTYNYSSVKDFIKKGIMFASGSILAAGMSFWVLYSLVTNLGISLYSETDSQAPSFLFYQSFWDTFKQVFPISPSVIITGENGAINLYCGLFVIALAFLSFLLIRKNKRILYKWLLLLFLIISSNNELLSYLWNGFHYQIMVPNRYAFLTVFLLIDLAYEALCHIHAMNIRNYYLTGGILLLFTGCTFLLAPNRLSTLSMALSVILIICYLIVLWLFIQKKQWSKHIVKFFGIVILLELSFTSCYNAVSKKMLDLSDYGIPVTEHVKENYLTDDNPLDRLSYIFPFTTNVGTIYNVGSVEQFNSYLTKYQYKMGLLNGSYHSDNIIRSTNSLTPFGMAISNIKYLVLDLFTVTNTAAVDLYTPVDNYYHSIILKNENTLSPAFYLPAGIADKTENVNTHTAFANLVCSELGLSGYMFSDNLLLLPADSSNPDNNDNYIDCTPNEGTNNNHKDFHHKLHFVAPKTGTYFYGVEEYHYLGELTQGKQYEFDIDCAYDYGYLCIYNQNIMDEMMETLKPYTFRTESQTNTQITGNITLPEDGIINFSIPYEPGWHAFLDGKEVETKALGEAYLYIEAAKGDHTVTLKFMPTCLKTGIYVTVFAWIIFFLICLLSTKRKHRNNSIKDTL